MTKMNETPDYGGRDWLVTSSFLCGALMGAGLAVLLAPARGRETRERLAARAREGRGLASEAWAQGKQAFDRTRDHLEDQRGRASRVVAEGGAALADMRERGEKALENIRHEAVGAIADAKAAFKAARAEAADKDEAT